jgi:pimeloyl-ACP methyl ester carboxylesterase
VARDLLHALGLARATLIGNSSGGRRAWRFAARIPERVDALVLIFARRMSQPGIPIEATRRNSLRALPRRGSP